VSRKKYEELQSTKVVPAEEHAKVVQELKELGVIIRKS